jgi:glycosidase
VNELDAEYQGYIINNKVSVISKWMNAGVSGWRLDVADELPDEFIDSLKKRALCENKEAIIIGEVWEDASVKKAYGVNKKYFTQGVLDGDLNDFMKIFLMENNR